MRALFLFVVLLLSPALGALKPTIRVGSKSFTESYILAEIIAEVIEGAGEARVERKFGLGQTGIAFEALANRKIDLYPEYTGTIAEALLKDPSLGEIGVLKNRLHSQGLVISDSLGFNNTYALAVRRGTAEALGLKAISDLKGHRDLRAGFSHEFVQRPDCYPRIQSVYGLHFSNLKSLSHALAYEALAGNAIDITDIYSTDAKVMKLDLSVLKDDRRAFPAYVAVILAHESLLSRFPQTWQALRKLERQFSESEMTRLNAMAEIDKKEFPTIARAFLKTSDPPANPASMGLWGLTWQHLVLVALSLVASVVVGIPLAILASEYRGLGQVILILSGIIQTIPSLALLCFLIPLFGIGTEPALVALFLYGLLPIVRGGYTGFTSIDPKHLEVAKAIGLSRVQRLRLVEFPLASQSLLAGIKTSAIISVGTATLAALIGAGGYGVPIVTGLALNDIPTILQGAIPAAVMALVVHGAFEGMDRVLIPKGLR